MYRKIIVGLSLEHGIAERALNAAASLGDEGAEIVAAHVKEPLQESVKVYIAKDDFDKARKQAESDLKARIAGHSGVASVVLEGQPGRSLTDYAAEIGADCIVVASHKPGLRDFLLGSTAARIVRHAPCSVHVLR